MVRYELPGFLEGVVSRATYVRWLQHKAQAHVVRDRKRVNWPVSVSAYKQAIHAAVVSSEGLDFYTDEPLHWSLISTYDNAASKAVGRSTRLVSLCSHLSIMSAAMMTGLIS